MEQRKDDNMKSCTKCKEVKDFSEYWKHSTTKDGLHTRCVSCSKEERRISYLNSDKSVRAKRDREYYLKNREEIIKKNNAHRASDKPKRNQYEKDKKAADPLYKLRGNLTRRIGKHIKRKSKSTKELTGCSYEELKLHLENQFKPGMSWDNYGEWHIDHIHPLALAKTEQELYELCHFSNLQPLWAEENMSKGCKTTYDNDGWRK